MAKREIRPTLTNGVAKVPVVMQMESLECGAAALAMVMAYADPAHHLLLQDIGYYCDAYMKDWHPDWEDLLEDADGTNPVEVGPSGCGQRWWPGRLHDVPPVIRLRGVHRGDKAFHRY